MELGPIEDILEPVGVLRATFSPRCSVELIERPRARSSEGSHGEPVAGHGSVGDLDRALDGRFLLGLLEHDELLTR